MKTSGLRRCLSRPVSLLLALCLSPAVVGCGSGIRLSDSVTIRSLSSEDVVPFCTYDLLLEPMAPVQKGVLVVFERGDTNLLYTDKVFRDQVQALHYAILWVHECYASSVNDMQADAAKGPGRMLFAAISQLAVSTQHPELESAGIILYGFSSAGVLTATMANDYPDRILGTIEFASGSGSTNLDKVGIASAAKIPALLLANANDATAGTSRSLRYFRRGRVLNAPWAFGVQNDTQHCCTLSTRSLILPWIQTIAQAHAASLNATQVISAGISSHFVCTPDGVVDSLGEVNCQFTAASLKDSAATAAQESGWLPDQDSATAWLAWVTNPTTNQP